MKYWCGAIVLCALGTLLPTTVHADPYLCDTSAENCRARVLDLIANEHVGIDVGFWFMDDSRYATALVKQFQAGVPVRVIMDPRANVSKPANANILDILRSAGIPMRKKSSGDIAHWKGMIFAGQQVSEFSGANYSPYEYLPQTPYVDYNDEVIYFSDEPDVVHSLMRHYDDVWTSYSGYANYANVVDPTTRNYPIDYTIAAEFNFPPDDSYFNRLHPLLQAESVGIDVTMFRITDSRPADDLIAAVRRHVPVRLYTEPLEYRNPKRVDDSYNIDRMYMAGVAIRMRAHAGQNHQKTVTLYGQGLTIFGTSNWSTASDDNQLEVNYFTTKDWFYNWFETVFDRKWNNSYVMPDGTRANESRAFSPLPPDKPTYSTPANLATAVDPSAVTLKWLAGYWARQYDIYVGVSQTGLHLLKGNVNLGPSHTTTELKSYKLPVLQPGTTYYWQIVSKTMANLTATGPVWSFTTDGTAPADTCADPAATNYTGSGACTYPAVQSTLPSPWTQSDIGAVGATGGTSYSNGLFTVTGAGSDIWGVADAFHFVYQPMTGDGDIVARVAGVQNVNGWTKAGVMIRNTLDAGSAFADMLVSAGKGTAFQYRTSAGAQAAGINTGAGAAPYWLKLSRAGNTFTGYQSVDGQAWTLIGSTTAPMAYTVYVGLAVSSHTATTAAANIDHVTIVTGPPQPPSPPASPTPGDNATAVSTSPTLTWTGVGATSYDVNFGTTATPSTVLTGQTSASYRPGTLAAETTYYWQVVAHNATGDATGPVWSFRTAAAPPPPSLAPGWTDLDIGAVGVAGSASSADGVFTVNGAGADIWGAADAFNYSYQTLTGDGEIVARVTSVQNVASWTKAGVMIRGSLDASAASAIMLVSASKGAAFQYRPAAGALTSSVSGGTSGAPRWVKVVRTGNVVAAFQSADGSAWTPAGSATIALPQTAYVGLAVSSHTTTRTAAATFDNVAVNTAAPAPPAAPSSPSPSNGAGTVTATPTLTWSASGATSYDVSFGTSNPPAAVALGQSVASYSPGPLTAGTTYYWQVVAHNDLGATNGPVWSFTTAPPSTLPSSWTDQDIGAVGAAGSASYANGVFSVSGAGADVWNSADAFHYASTTLTGDGQLIARVASVQNVAAWTKAGLMIRDTLDANSAYAFMLVSASKGTAFQYRGATGAAAQSVTGTTAAAPRWLKVVRSGNMVSGFQSADGVAWQPIGSASIALGSTVNIGLAVSSHTTAAAATATFDGVQ